MATRNEDWPDCPTVKQQRGQAEKFVMTNSEGLIMIGYHHLGGGYDNEAYILAAKIWGAAQDFHLKYGSDDYPQTLQEAMRCLESYAIAKDREIKSNRMRVEESIYNGDCNVLVDFADSSKVYGLIKEFDLHRLSPVFKSEALNAAINKARAEHVASYPTKPSSKTGCIVPLLIGLSGLYFAAMVMLR